MSKETYRKYLEKVKDSKNIADIPLITKFKLPFLLASERLGQDEYEQLLKIAYENLSEQIPNMCSNLEFKSNKNKAKWETKDRLKLVEMLLPDEDGFDQSRMIRLSDDDYGVALYIAQRMGTVTSMQFGVKVVSERAVLVLNMLDVKFEIIK